MSLMNPTQTRKLGKSGVALTQLGFGGAPLGELFVRVDEATAAATLQAAWDAGVRYYDTAPYYGRGLSEIRYGRFLDAKPRSDFVLSSKVGRWFFPPARPDEFQTSPVWAGGLRFEHVHDYSYDGIMRSYEQSQMRLGMNRIDLLLIHDLDFWFHTTEAKVAAHLSQLFTSGWRALDQLRSLGLVRGVGAGINELGMMPRFLDALPLDFFLVALRYTLMEQEVLEAEFPYCERAGVGIVIGGVYSSGITATGPIEGAKYNYSDAAPEVMQRVRRMQAVCASHATPLAAAALQFPLAHPIVASVIPGAISPDQVRQNVENFRRPIPASLWSDLKREGLISERAPTPAD
jgi:D-threo-aldose 1-dehydrogenase